VTKTKRKPIEDLELPPGAAAEEDSREPTAPGAVAKDAAPPAAFLAGPCVSVRVPFTRGLPENLTVAGDLHLELQLRRPASQRAFKQVWDALLADANRYRLANGRPIVSMANAVEWIIEQVAAAMPAE
jgi:hypothetical protein